MRPETVCGLLAEPERLAVFAAVVLGATDPEQVGAATRLPARDVAAALRRLRRGGLVSADTGALAADTAAFKEAVRATQAPRTPAEPLDPDPTRAAVLRAFIRDGRLTQLPTARGKRRVVLEHLAACFEPGVTYPEREVDAVLRAWHPDHASLRRYLVDEGLMSRAAGTYWRTGGPVDTGAPTGGSGLVAGLGGE